MTQDINHLISNPDGKVWAKEFADTASRLYGVDLDEDWLEAWFANAIMAGYDYSYRTYWQDASKQLPDCTGYYFVVVQNEFSKQWAETAYWRGDRFFISVADTVTHTVTYWAVPNIPFDPNIETTAVGGVLTHLLPPPVVFHKESDRNL